MPTATDTLEALARSIQASENITYAQAYSRVLSENPHLYAEAVTDAQAQAQAVAESEAPPARQFTESSYASAAEEYALRPVEADAKRFREQDPRLTEAQAFAKALAQNPDAYDQVDRLHLARTLRAEGMAAPQAQAAEPRQFSSDMWGSSTPAGVARQERASAVLQDINKALEPLQRRYLAAPRDVLLAMLFDGNPGLRQRCISLARSMT